MKKYSNHMRAGFLLLLLKSAIGFVVSSSSNLQVLRFSLYSTSNNHNDDALYLQDRRSTLNQLAFVVPLLTLNNGGAEAAEVTTGLNTANSITTTPSTLAKVTDKVFMDVRISRGDGTFYVRDDLPDTPENKVFYGRLVLGLFGEIAPTHVKRFLTYVDVTYNPLDDNPLPSYGRSNFQSFDQATGLLMGGFIPSLEIKDIGGSAAIKYGGRILPASLWAEKNAPPKLSHNQKGLLTHRNLELAPIFGVTTRTNTAELDGTNTVFGQILLDESSTEFLKIVQDLKTYSLERPSTEDGTAVDDVAKVVFDAQRQIFRGAAKSFGDTRLSKVYEGKLLRRVEVTKVGIL